MQEVDQRDAEDPAATEDWSLCEAKAEAAAISGQATTILGTGSDPSVVDELAATRGAAKVGGDEPLAAGTKVDRYELGEVLGVGGMGIVYRAFDSELGRSVALKLVRPGGDAEQSVGKRQGRLLREARAMARLAHPHTVAVYDVGTFAEQVFVAMELIDGVNLARWLESRRPWREVLAVLQQAGRGLAAAHAADLVHRDFKPENVLVGRDGRARVGDFGLATATATATATAPAPSSTLADTEPLAPLERGSLTHLGVVIGTPLFMAPEQHLGAPVDPRTDQFSFCVTLYLALFGKHPFVGDTREALVRSILAGAVVEPGREARVPRAVVRALRRGLAARPPDRHPSMQALLDELERGSRRRVGLWLASATGAGLVAAGAAVALMGEPATPSPEREPEVAAPLEVPSQPLLRTDRRQQLTFSGDAFLPQLTADGRFLAFVAVAPLRSRLIVQELATGTAQTLSWWRRIEDIRWSPDETRILVRSDHGITVVPRDEGRRMVHAHAAFAAWSADGHALVLADLPRQLRIRDLASSKERAVPLTALPAGSTIAGLDWSAATDRLLLLVSDERGWSLWTLRPDGSELRRVFSDSESVRAVNPRWTTDGGSLTYHRVSTSGRELALLRVPTDGAATELGPLLRGSDASLDYSLARDGRSIAHVQEQHDDNVVLLDPGAPDAEARFEHLTTGSQLKSSVVPGRDAIAFVVGPAWEADQLFVVARMGGPPRQLTRDPAAIHSVAWAPDGQSLAYTRRGSEGIELWRIELTSAEERRIAVPGLELQGSLVWASERALLCRERSEDAAWHVVDLVTGSRRPLADPSAGRIEQIRASPDGSQVAVMWSRKDRTNRLWKLSLVDDKQVELSERYVWPIGWSDDGSTVYGSDFRDPVRKIVGIAATSGEERPILTVPDALVLYADDLSALGAGRFVGLDRRSRSDIWISGEFSPQSIASVAAPTTELNRTPGPLMPVNASPQNVDLEEGELGQLPRGWQLDEDVYPDAMPVLTDVEPYSGRLAARIEQGPGEYNYLGQYIDPAPYRGKQLRLRVMLRMRRSAAVAAGRTRLFPYMWCERANGLEESGVPSLADLRPTEAWSRREVVFRVPQDCATLNFGASLYGDAIGWADAFELTIIK